MRKKLLVALLSFAVVATACGGDDDSKENADDSDSTATTDVLEDSKGEDASDGVEAARQFLEEYSANPTSILLEEPLSEVPEEGKYIISSQTSPPSDVVNAASRDAAELLGWKYESIQIDGSPEAASKFFDAALAKDPDGILIAGRPSATFAEGLAEAERRGIPVVSQSTVDEVGGGIISSSVSGPEQVYLWGRMIAADMVVQSGGNANTVLVNISGLPIFDSFVEGFHEAVDEWCDDCKVTDVTVQISDLGTNVAPAVVSEVQRDPSIDHVVFSLGAAAVGVSEALDAGGFTDISFSGETPTAANLEALKNGTESAWTGFSSTIVGWRVIDVLARHFYGDELDVVEETLLPTQVLTPENIDNAVLDDKGEYLGVEDYREQFMELWGVEG